MVLRSLYTIPAYTRSSLFGKNLSIHNGQGEFIPLFLDTPGPHHLERKYQSIMVMWSSYPYSWRQQVIKTVFLYKMIQKIWVSVGITIHNIDECISFKERVLLPSLCLLMLRTNKHKSYKKEYEKSYIYQIHPSISNKHVLALAFFYYSTKLYIL